MSSTSYSETPPLSTILKKFPYSREDDQIERLAHYLDIKMSGNTGDVKQQTGITHPTRRKIESTYQDLSKQERKKLLHVLTDCL